MRTTPPARQVLWLWKVVVVFTYIKFKKILTYPFVQKLSEAARYTRYTSTFCSDNKHLKLTKWVTRCSSRLGGVVVTTWDPPFKFVAHHQHIYITREWSSIGWYNRTAGKFSILPAVIVENFRKIFSTQIASPRCPFFIAAQNIMRIDIHHHMCWSRIFVVVAVIYCNYILCIFYELKHSKISISKKKFEET